MSIISSIHEQMFIKYVRPVLAVLSSINVSRSADRYMDLVTGTPRIFVYKKYDEYNVMLYDVDVSIVDRPVTTLIDVILNRFVKTFGIFYATSIGAELESFSDILSRALYDSFTEHSKLEFYCKSSSDMPIKPRKYGAGRESIVFHYYSSRGGSVMSFSPTGEGEVGVRVAGHGFRAQIIRKIMIVEVETVDSVSIPSIDSIRGVLVGVLRLVKSFPLILDKMLEVLDSRPDLARYVLVK